MKTRPGFLGCFRDDVGKAHPESRRGPAWEGAGPQSHGESGPAGSSQDGQASPREELGLQCQRALALKVQGTDVGREWTLFLQGQSSCIGRRCVGRTIVKRIWRLQRSLKMQK